MRQILWLVLALAVVAPVAFWYQTQRQPAEDALTGAGIVLTNRPTTYCPKTAKVVAIKTSQPNAIHFEGNALVAGCDAVRLPTESLNEAVEYQVFVLVERARAFRVVLSGPVTSYQSFPIQLGDINGDNTVNEADQASVRSALTKPEHYLAALDVDGDQKITVLDYSLVVVNQGVGVDRPDGKLWGATQ